MQRKVLSEVVDYLHKAYPDASIGVGGSVAIGTYRADSDVDILFQQEDCHKNFLVSFSHRGIKVSIFGFSRDGLRWSEQRFLMNHHNMPVAFILNVVVIYDNKKLIADLKGFIREAIERRKALKYVLIDELKARIETQLQIEPISCFDAKRKSCNIINMIIFIFYLKFHADRIVQKLEGCNPYDVIKQDDYILYEKPKGCLPYSFKSYRQLKELFENYINNVY